MSERFSSDRPFLGLNEHLRSLFGEKVGKLCLDGGFSCPNRDGTLGWGGCLFCDEMGSGAFAAGRALTLAAQVEAQKSQMAGKWKMCKFIAFFQSFTNTYAAVDVLAQKYNEALRCEGVVGLAIATRPDALPDPVLALLASLAKRTHLWVELGFQTAQERSAQWLRRGYEGAVFDAAVAKLRERGIPVVAHLILGLPGESASEMVASALHCARIGVSGLKLHMLHVVRGTDLHAEYKRDPFTLLSQEQYIALVADILDQIPPEMVIHRITGDGARATLVAPLWTLEKKRVYTGVIAEMRRRGSVQGCRAPTSFGGECCEKILLPDLSVLRR